MTLTSYFRQAAIKFSNHFSDVLAEVRVRTNPKYRAIRCVIRDRLTYLGSRKLLLLANTVRLLESKNVTGTFIEAGCGLGGSAIIIAYFKNKSRPFSVYDVFKMIPPPGERDGADAHGRYKVIAEGKATGISGDKYYGYEEDLLGKVRNVFVLYGLDIKKNNVTLIEGLFKDTLQIQEPVAFAHIDCDWYDSVYTCLEKIIPNLSVGGIVVIDDYYAFSGCRDAVHEYFKNKSRYFEFKHGPSLVIKRIDADIPNHSQKKSVVLWGASGFYNMGDEAMLAGNLETLKALLGDAVQLIVLSYNPDYTSHLHNVPSIYDFFWLMTNKAKGRFKILKATKLALMCAKLLWNASRLKKGKLPRFCNFHEKQFLLTLANSEALLLVGAGNINDIMLRGGLMARSFTSCLAEILSKPVFMGAQTVGPLNSSWTRWLARKFLESAKVVTLRETLSAKLVKDIGVKHNELYVVADDAFNISPLSREEANKVLLKEEVNIKQLKERGLKVIAIIPRAWWKRDSTSMRLRVALRDIIRFLAGKERYYTLFVSTSFNRAAPGDDDTETARELIERTGAPKLTNYRILTNNYDWHQLKGILGLADFVIGSSYHSIVFSLSMGVPSIGLYADEYYRLKIGGLFDLIGLGDLAIDVNKTRTDELIKTLERCLDKEEALREHIVKRTAHLKESSCLAAKLLVKTCFQNLNRCTYGVKDPEK